MMFRLSAALLLASSALGYDPMNLRSPSAQKLLNMATVIEPAKADAQRHLEEREINFLHRYNIKYIGCTDLIQINREGGDEGLLYTQHLVKFALCPSDEGCGGSCSGGGQYVVDMLEFVDAYTEAKLDEQEYQCEMIRENCYCNGYNDDEACENSCYMQAGMDVCIEYEGQEEFEVQRYLECAEMDDQNGNNNNNGNYYYGNNQNNFYGQYYIAPYCATDGVSIFLGVFYDEQCMNQADTSVYAEKNYGQSLPFSAQALVTPDDCIPCKDYENDNNNNNNNNGNNNNNNNNGNNWYYEQDVDVTEFCENSYQEAARCETNMAIQYPDTSGCGFINEILPRMEKATNPYSKNKTSGGGGGGGAATAFAWLFGISTVLFGAYAYFLYRKIKRGSVNLSSQEGAMA